MMEVCPVSASFPGARRSCSSECIQLLMQILVGDRSVDGLVLRCVLRETLENFFGPNGTNVLQDMHCLEPDIAYVAPLASSDDVF
jgi:hypothetical protein